jgi:hypothetical protein
VRTCRLYNGTDGRHSTEFTDYAVYLRTYCIVSFLLHAVVSATRHGINNSICRLFVSVTRKANCIVLLTVVDLGNQNRSKLYCYYIN